MNGFWGHLTTINRHRHQVIKNCARAGIFWQGLRHDLSKYSPTEFWAGVKHFQGTRSPNAKERELYGYSRAWLHHKGRNRHHFEYWTDFSPAERKTVPVKMPFRFVVEMFCDRVAASKIYMREQYNDASALNYYLRAEDHRFIHPQTATLIEALLRMLAEQGEDATFRYIRQQVKLHRHD